MAHNYEVSITVTDTERLKDAILFLVDNGYNVYVNKDDFREPKLCFTAPSDEVTEITYQQIPAQKPNK